MLKVIAIDGPSGSGKGTLARGLAGHFNFAYMDTGLIYRVIAYSGTTEENCEDFSFEQYDKICKQVPVTDFRTDEISLRASQISKSEKIRAVATRLMRQFITSACEKFSGAILDGRDIGTVVAPDAFCKFFVTADLKIRAERRYADLKKTNASASFEEIYKNLEKRDASDTNRSAAPLTLNDSYILIDTSEESAEETLHRLIKIVEEKIETAFPNALA